MPPSVPERISDLVIWVVVAIIIVLIHRRASGPGTGLVASFIAGLWLMHWTGGFLYVLPWFYYTNLTLVWEGFKQSSYGLFAFGAGVLIISILRYSNILRVKPANNADRITTLANLPRNYLLVGIVSYLVVFPSSIILPSLTAVSSTSNMFIIIGLCLFCWRAARDGDTLKLVFWLMAGLLLPVYTVTALGFLGFGVAAFLSLITFVTGVVRLRLSFIIALLLMVFFALSFYVTYMRDRSDLRASLGSENGINERIDRFGTMISTFEWFDITNKDHLHRIDERLNQNTLLGAAIYNLNTGRVRYVYGETLLQAVVNLVPRAIWPDKPIHLGGNTVVSYFTGMRFAIGTTVGVGQLMDAYINFGTYGVIAVFFALGLAVASFDGAAASAIQHGDWKRFAFWYLSGTGFIQPNNALFEITATIAGGMLSAFLVNRFILPRFMPSTVDTSFTIYPTVPPTGQK